jgi:hypothetical protein
MASDWVMMKISPEGAPCPAYAPRTSGTWWRDQHPTTKISVSTGGDAVAGDARPVAGVVEGATDTLGHDGVWSRRPPPFCASPLPLASAGDGFARMLYSAARRVTLGSGGNVTLRRLQKRRYP